MIEEFSVSTHSRTEFVDITDKAREAVRRAIEERAVKSGGAGAGEAEGRACVFCPHTTAAITINENADPDVLHDLEIGLAKAFPDRAEFRHSEGNSAAHLKSSCVGASETILIKEGKLLLGTWQSIYFCEFDGPRRRRFFVQVELFG